MALAIGLYPEPDGTEYWEEDLSDEAAVYDLFVSCSQMDTYLTKSGWEYLIDNFGYETLYDLDKQAGYLDCESVEQYEEWVGYEIEDAPE